MQVKSRLGCVMPCGRCYLLTLSHIIGLCSIFYGDDILSVIRRDCKHGHVYVVTGPLGVHTSIVRCIIRYFFTTMSKVLKETMLCL